MIMTGALNHPRGDYRPGQRTTGGDLFIPIGFASGCYIQQQYHVPPN
jgi:hypothetical protein